MWKYLTIYYLILLFFWVMFTVLVITTTKESKPIKEPIIIRWPLSNTLTEDGCKYLDEPQNTSEGDWMKWIIEGEDNHLYCV